MHRTNNFLYFANAFVTQQPFIKAMTKRFKLRGKNILSIASGTCAEEVIMALSRVKSVTCVDPDYATLSIGITASVNIPNISFANYKIQEFQAKEKFDFVYTSAPSDWLDDIGWEGGMPDHYIDAINKYAKDNVVIMLYGPKYEPFIDEEHFLNMIDQQLEDFYILEWWDMTVGNILVLGREERVIPDHPDFVKADLRWLDKEGGNCKRVYQWTPSKD